jgi:poly(A) polymerase
MIYSMDRNAVDIVKTLQDAGYQAVLAGGCVRDIILGNTPNDYDIATSATPDQVEQLFAKTIPVGKSFGVIVVLMGNEQYEVATFRNDGQYSDGRRPDSVSFSSMKEDALRRDFSINGMFMDPVKNEIIDYVDGRRDINEGIVCFIGNAQDRINEDRLRMLRAIRFALKLDFQLDTFTYGEIVKNAHRIIDISVERIRDEITKMLRIGKPRQMFELLLHTGLMGPVLPEIKAMKGCEQNPAWHAEGDVWEHTIRVLDALPKDASDELRWATLLHDVGKPPCSTVENGVIRCHGHADVGAQMTQEILTRFKFSNDFIDRVVELVGDHMKPYDSPKMKKSTIRRLLGKEYFNDLVTLCVADCEGTLRTVTNGKFVGEWLPVFETVKANLKNEPVLPPPLIGGKELIELGMKPGPIFKKILDEISEAQLEGTITTREEALGIARNYC